MNKITSILSLLLRILVTMMIMGSQVLFFMVTYAVMGMIGVIAAFLIVFLTTFSIFAEYFRRLTMGEK